MFCIEIDVFSGRTNPKWTFDDEKFKELCKKFPDINAAATTIPGPPRLGYRGIKIQISSGLATEYHLPQEFWLGNGYSANEAYSRNVAETLINELITDTELKEMILSELSSMPFPRQNPDLQQKQKKSEHIEIYAPNYWDDFSYDPGYWNSNVAILYNNNCYAYATAKATNTFPQPGRKHGYKLQKRDLENCTTVAEYAKIDGLFAGDVELSISFAPRLRVALAIAPGLDYHWYREVVAPDGEVIWAHKPGSTKVIDTDNSGKVITDPQSADRGIYTLWCEYMISPLPLVSIE